jgi:general secretion pathway protein A
VIQPGSRRPLLDLFPLAPSADRPASPSTRGGAAPRLARPIRDAARHESFERGRPQLRSHDRFYGFVEPAFGLEPDLRFLYHSAEHDRAAQRVAEAVAQRSGLVVLTAPTGLGKTLLCLAIASALDRRTLWSIVSAPVASFDALVRTLLADLGVLSREELSRAADPAELAKRLRLSLASLASRQGTAVIMVDEAQDASPEVLTALHALAAGAPRSVQVVLVGQPALTRVLGRSELRAVDERVALRLELGALAADEVAGYVVHRVHVAAPSPRVEFDDRAFARVYEISGGVPRLVNQVCDRALAHAFESSATIVDSATVDAAADDLGIAPAFGRRETMRTAALALGFAALAAIGAGGAAWLFRDRVLVILQHWRALTP